MILTRRQLMDTRTQFFPCRPPHKLNIVEKQSRYCILCLSFRCMYGVENSVMDSQYFPFKLLEKQFSNLHMHTEYSAFWC